MEVYFYHLYNVNLQQEGQLCAQHCLNALLQGPYYTAVDLATIAGQLDEEERRSMAGGTAGENSEEYRRFIAQPSANMDDTGQCGNRGTPIVVEQLDIIGIKNVPHF